MRTRPTRFPSSIRSSWLTGCLGLALVLAAGSARPAAAWQWEGSTADRIISTGIDVSIVRPLAAVRAGVGAVMLVPAVIFASPGCAVNLIQGTDCRPNFEAPYELLVQEPVEYAFGRKLGEL